MSLKEKLLNIQAELKAPKGQMNNYGGYKYRSCEDILEAVKPLLKANKCVLTISDEIANIGERYYIRAAATITDAEGDESYTNVAYAREEETKKGMDGAQITGTASSYARKYALNGLFLIDDTKDADTDEHAKQTGAEKKTSSEDKKASAKQIELVNKLVKDKDAMLKYYKVDSVEALTMQQASEIITKLKDKGAK